MKVYIPPVGFLFYGLLFLCGELDTTALLLMSALLHEGGHLLSAYFLGVRVEGLTILPLGADIRLDKWRLSYRREGWIAFSGPLFNLIGFMILALCGRGGSLFGLSNLLLALFNLLPVEGLDGGRVLRSFLSQHSAADTVDRISGIVGGIVLLLLYLWGVFWLIKVNGSPLLLVLTCFLFYQRYVAKR